MDEKVNLVPLERIPKTLGEIKLGGAFMVIAKILGLKGVQGRKRIFESATAQRYVLTKFGFQPVENYNWRVLYQELYKENEKLKYKAGKWDTEVSGHHSKYTLHLERELERITPKAEEAETIRKKERKRIKNLYERQVKKWETKIANLHRDLANTKNGNKKWKALRESEHLALEDVIDFAIKKRILPKNAKHTLMQTSKGNKIADLGLPETYSYMNKEKVIQLQEFALFLSKYKKKTKKGEEYIAKSKHLLNINY